MSFRFVAIGVMLAACKKDEGGSDDPPGSLTVEVAVSTPAPDRAPLARAIHVEASAPVGLVVEWTDGDHTVELAFDTPAAVHDHVLLGFRPDRTYTMTVTADSGSAT